MREVEFKAWLRQRRYRGKPLSTISQRLNWCRAVERALPELGLTQRDLEAVHAEGRWSDLLAALSKLRSNWRNNEAAARVIAPQSANPGGQMANARSSVGMYGRFLAGDDPNHDGAGPPESSDEEDELTDQDLLERFIGKEGFRTWWAGWPDPNRQAFFRVVRALHNAGLDWYHVNIDRQVRCGRKKKGAIDATEVFVAVSNLDASCWVRRVADRAAMGLPDTAVPLSVLADRIEAAPEALQRFAGGTAYWPDELSADPAASMNVGVVGSPTGRAAVPTNLILYGPPGTGKTWRTAEVAVKLCDGSAPADRDALMQRYRELVEARRIEFATFHQSYSYEEFVEGLRPVTDAGVEGGAAPQGAGFRLEPRRGIFREICSVAENARKTAGRSGGFDLGGRKLFKMSLGRAGIEDHIFDAAIEGDYVVLGWGGEVDWSDPTYEDWSAMLKRWQHENPAATGNDPNVVQMWPFRSAMKPGDLVVVSAGNSHFRAVGEVTGPYRFEPTETRDYNHRRPVHWLLVPDEPLPAELIYAKKFMMQSCYQLKDGLVNRGALSRLLPGLSAEGGDGADQFVLIIDEINRANISKVFGELITLVEPDKRKGMLNAIEVRLPYSKEPFSVPANLHIIGTMNTADRSIALIDKALRRRFTFREMLPDYSVEGMECEIVGTDVTLAEVLQTLNVRIEYLLDREHQIGHGWLLGCATKADLDEAMRDKVIPLIAEYFFEDWGRTADVLGGRDDNPFLEAVALEPPPGVDGEPRYRWLLRAQFAPDAYLRLIGRA